MSDLVERAILAHGGMETFGRFSQIKAKLHQGGVLWALKGKPTVLEDCEVTVWTKEQKVSHGPFAPSQDHSVYTPDRVTIVDPQGRIVEDLVDPRASFAGYEMETPWSNPQVAYFAGYTMWTYLTSPFILRQPGVAVEDIGSWDENGETFQRLRVSFPERIATHSQVQTFYFDAKGLLRRHDYEVDIQGKNAAARYLLEPVTVQGIVMPSKLRIYPRLANDAVAAEPLIVTVDLSDYRCVE
jgi:hypothetical protein